MMDDDDDCDCNPIHKVIQCNCLRCLEKNLFRPHDPAIHLTVSSHPPNKPHTVAHDSTLHHACTLYRCSLHPLAANHCPPTQHKTQHARTC